MKIKTIEDENFTDYKLPSMLIATAKCDWKCCREAGLSTELCQNSELAKQPDIEVSCEEIYKRYIDNPITKAIVLGGLEPFLQIFEIIELIKYFRNKNCEDPFVIYSGCELNEVYSELMMLNNNKNIIVKLGRYKLNYQPKFDEVLGITLAGENQKAYVL